MSKTTSKKPAGKTSAPKGASKGKKSSGTDKAKSDQQAPVAPEVTPEVENSSVSVTSTEVSAAESNEGPSQSTPEPEKTGELPAGDNPELPEPDGGIQDQGDGSVEKPAARLAVVIPYLKAQAQGSELLYAIRSIAKNFMEDSIQLVVIGDSEDWFGSEILHIEHQCIGGNPQADVLDKVKVILADDRISDEFVWTNDDIYFVAPTTLEDIRLLKAEGKLCKEPHNGSLYNANRSKTIDLLLSKDLPIRNFDAHMPISFTKEQMVEVFEAFPEMHTEGLLMASMYFNYHVRPDWPAVKLDWESDEWKLRVISGLETEEKKQTFRRLIGTKRFLNHSEAGFSKLLMDWLSRQFPEKSRFEK